MAQAERASVAFPALSSCAGLDPQIAAAFRAVSRERAPGLAAAYGRLWRKVTGRIGKAPWGAPWPESWARPLGWRQAATLAFRGLGDLDPRLAGRARALWLRRRVRRLTGAPQLCAGRTSLRPLGPLAQVQFDGSAAAGVTLAHELGHAAMMARGWFGGGAPTSCRAGAEAGAFLAEHAFRTVLAAADSRAGAGRWAEDHLALLVRHPARDALEAATAAGIAPEQAWPELAAAYAPALAWAPLTPAAGSQPGLTLTYAVAYAVGLVVSRSDARGSLGAWIDLGPDATLEALALLADLPLRDVRGYHRAFDLAEADLAQAARLD